MKCSRNISARSLATAAGIVAVALVGSHWVLSGALAGEPGKQARSPSQQISEGVAVDLVLPDDSQKAMGVRPLRFSDKVGLIVQLWLNWDRGKKKILLYVYDPEDVAPVSRDFLLWARSGGANTYVVRPNLGGQHGAVPRAEFIATQVSVVQSTSEKESADKRLPLKQARLLATNKLLPLKNVAPKYAVVVVAENPASPN